MPKKINHAARAHALLSASGAELWLHCPASAVANEQYPNEGNEYTQEGTIAHEVAQVYAEAARDKSGHSELDAALKALRAKWDGAVTGEMLECAEAYAAYIQEHVSGKDDTVLLEQRLDFSPWVPQGFGTGDCVIISTGAITVIDYKYGQGVAVDSKDNPQMMLYALGAINDYGCIYDFDTVRMSIYQPRINNISEAVMSVADLLAWAEGVVVPAAKAAFSGEAEYHAGAWCRKFCRHAGRCPTLAAYCSDFVETHGLRVPVPHLTDDQYLEIVQMKPLIKMWLDRITRTATDRILGGEPIPGLKVVEGRSLRKWADEDRVLDVLTTEPIGVSAEALYEPATLKSVAAMEKALGKKKVAELVGDLIEKTPGKPILTTANDKRPDYDPGADFKILE